MLGLGVGTVAFVAMASLFLIEYRRLRAETRRVGTEARMAEARFRNSFRYATTGMAVLSPDGRYLEVNDALCRILGRTEDQLLQLRFSDVRHPDDVDDTTAVRDRLLNSEDSHEFIEK